MDDFLTTNKLWRLLEIALGDLKAIENTPGYKVYMWNYHVENDGVCHVCLAGASLVRHDCVKAFKAHDNNLVIRCEAIDGLRRGWVPLAAKAFGIEYHGDYVNIRGYHVDRNGWWEDMAALLADLKAANI